MAESAAAAGGANWQLAVAALTLLIGIFGALAFLVLRMGSGDQEKPVEQAAPGPGGGQKRRGALDRMQRNAARSAAAGGGGNAGEEDDGDEEGTDGADRAARRNAQKQQKKQERRDQQQAERQVRQQQDTAKSEKQQKYEQKQKEREAERQRKEEEEQKAREDKEKKEQAEFDQWKEMFAIEAEGEDDSANTESAVENFIDYVKVRKVVNLEDLAAEFRMRTSAAIDRLEQLEKLGRLSGIFDDRGKYVYITQEEMSAVADWLRKKGRISRADLVAGCNRIIRLNPTAEDRAKLEWEAKTAAASLDEGAEGGAGEGPEAAIKEN